MPLWIDVACLTAIVVGVLFKFNGLNTEIAKMEAKINKLLALEAQVKLHEVTLDNHDRKSRRLSQLHEKMRDNLRRAEREITRAQSDASYAKDLAKKRKP